MTSPLSWLLGTASVLIGLGLLWVNNQPDGERGLYLVILSLVGALDSSFCEPDSDRSISQPLLWQHAF